VCVLGIIFVGVVVKFVVDHHSARMDIGMPVCNGDIRAYIGFLVVNVKARGETTSRRTLEHFVGNLPPSANYTDRGKVLN